VIEGEVVETGVGFTVTYDYNKFKELFARKPKAEREREKENKKKKKELEKEKKAADKAHDDQTTEVQPADLTGLDKQTFN
jgi:hypothetical protein